ncbi:hypothetical protein BASA81_008064 [Batrachochytrium salamandrivorans]|nr:hypothetical protein BASA81_008064 [Batrachochytrium salamandrivorans]
MSSPLVLRRPTTEPSEEAGGVPRDGGKILKSFFPELREKSEEHKIKRSVIFTSMAQRKSLWENTAKAYKDKQAMNVFSGQFDKTKDERIDPATYGKPVEGSKTEDRAKEASAWVDKEIAKLVEVIKQIGTVDAQEGGITVEFGLLFDTYVDISDTLVGILMRAKKRQVLKYPGQMLYQGASGKVKITLL